MENCIPVGLVITSAYVSVAIAKALKSGNCVFWYFVVESRILKL